MPSTVAETPVTLTSRRAAPRYPLVRLRLSAGEDPVTALIRVLGFAGVHCGVIDQAMSQVRVDRRTLHRWVVLDEG